MFSSLKQVLETIGPLSRVKAGWCLREGLLHLAKVDDGKMLPLVLQHGVPSFYSCFRLESNRCRHEATQNLKDPVTCFESLCRTIAGQFVSGYSAQAAWKRLLDTTSNELTPEHVLSLVLDEKETIDQTLVETNFRKPAGLTKAKTASIIDLAAHFKEGKLSEDFLKTTVDEREIRKALLQVKGIGPWSCDMFLIFFLERPDVLPIGDLGVRKGIAKYFELRGSQKKDELCPRKDLERITERLCLYKPYLSLVTYYMWRAADTPTLNDISRKGPKKLVCVSPNRGFGTAVVQETLPPLPDENGLLRKRKFEESMMTPEIPSRSKRLSSRRIVTP